MKLFCIVVLAILLDVFDGANGHGKHPEIKRNKTEISPAGRVYGGYLVRQDDPQRQGFTVRITYYLHGTTADDACSGAIITSEWVIATAWCLEAPNSDDTFDVRITDLQGTRWQTTLTETVLNPDYDSNTLVNNIGMGKVADPYTFNDYLFPVSEGGTDWYNDYFTGEKLNFCGYEDVYTVDTYLIEEPTCNTFVPWNRRRCEAAGLDLTSTEFCAASSDYTIVAGCYYDFGAVLVYYDPTDGTSYAYGLASYTTPNVCTKGPTAYLNLVYYNAWIESVLSD
ncbi:transmembrane protease serine 2-like [Lutzomyia longipalpis]|uniref:transmembrane protease serine 2-like n=1 Tax=Lutzomyia longipalpis TaxID=7200 RepID=UPI0024841866|nr:transmembrane protease serine 2-like [Lutzomyia longipalpis]